MSVSRLVPCVNDVAVGGADASYAPYFIAELLLGTSAYLYVHEHVLGTVMAHVVTDAVSPQAVKGRHAALLVYAHEHLAQVKDYILNSFQYHI